ncbi:hypothetical protein EJP82_02335 [Paenibacillus anaericanus]|uniref:Uncharacterized protein n=1 Tax=Paenibacillus anaericanus TaxID=170367 RepID=A0A3S1ELA7_9BACL|nr:hypothetical protein [Paenibacillus anaericanus]RUT48001.1 hypothetical protein EJP82_02335 [Paenibacillus anaericanus]
MEITKLIQETDGEIDEIEVWSEGGKRNFWYTKLNSFRMYDISFTKNGEKKHAIYSYPEGYLLESIEGRSVTGKWYLAPK